MKIGVTMFEEETTLSYTLSDNGYIKVYDSLRGKCIDSEVFKRTNKPIIEDLREILKAYFQRMRYFSGLPTYIHSPVFTASAFNNILDDIKQESELVKEKDKG
jgi:S-formylglutathione hydrolase FrmB